jgi:MerR family transcriptional regulator, light-induced transcriptional regulator
MARKLAEIGVPLAFGGAVFNHVPEIIQVVPGHFLGNKLEQVPQKVEKLIQTTPATGKVKEASRVYQAAYQHFVAQRAAVEAYLHASPQLADMSATLLSHTNQEFGNNIESALLLGDLLMISAHLDWVQGLLLNNHQRLSEPSLKQYLQQYHEAVKSVMDKRAAPILDWFAQLD